MNDNMESNAPDEKGNEGRDIMTGKTSAMEPNGNDDNGNVGVVLLPNEDDENKNNSEVTQETIMKLDERMVEKKISYLEAKAVWHEKSITFYNKESKRLQKEEQMLDEECETMLVKFSEMEKKKQEYDQKRSLIRSEKWTFQDLVGKHKEQLIKTRNEKTCAEQRSQACRFQNHRKKPRRLGESNR